MTLQKNQEITYLWSHTKYCLLTVPENLQVSATESHGPVNKQVYLHPNTKGPFPLTLSPCRSVCWHYCLWMIKTSLKLERNGSGSKLHLQESLPSCSIQTLWDLLGEAHFKVHHLWVRNLLLKAGQHLSGSDSCSVFATWKVWQSLRKAIWK